MNGFILTDGQPMGEQMTTDGFIAKDPKSWKKVKKMIDAVVLDTKRQNPGARVELKQLKYCWHITINGVPDMEVTVEDISKNIN